MTTTTHTAKPTTTQQVEAFVAACREAGFQIDSRSYGQDFVIEVSAWFTPGDVNAYLAAERASQRTLALAPMTYSGTVWGSDSGSVGGHAALTSGSFRMCKSGVSKRFGKALVARVGR